MTTSYLQNSSNIQKLTHNEITHNSKKKSRGESENKDSEKMTSEFLSTLSLKGNVKPYMLILENKKGTKPVIFVYTLKS